MLTESETTQLVELLQKMEWPLDPRIFAVLVSKIVTVPIELAVFNDTGKILMIHRDDNEFVGWHIPGTVMRDTDTVDIALARLLEQEVDGMTTINLMDLGWYETGRDVTPTRHAVALLQTCTLSGEYTGKGAWFDPNNLPEGTLKHHISIIAEVMDRLAQ